MHRFVNPNVQNARYCIERLFNLGTTNTLPFLPELKFLPKSTKLVSAVDFTLTLVNFGLTFGRLWVNFGSTLGHFGLVLRVGLRLLWVDFGCVV